MAVLSHFDGIVAFKEQKLDLKAFVGVKDVFTVLQRGFGKSHVKHCGAKRRLVQLPSKLFFERAFPSQVFSMGCFPDGRVK